MIEFLLLFAVGRPIMVYTTYCITLYLSQKLYIQFHTEQGCRADIPAPLHSLGRRRRRLAGGALAVAPARAAHHLVLGRVVAEQALDRGAQAFELVPQDLVQRIPLVAQVGQLGLERLDPGIQLVGLGQVLAERGLGQLAEGQRGADLLPRFQMAAGLIDQIGWVDFGNHLLHSLFQWIVPGAHPQIVYSMQKNKWKVNLQKCYPSLIHVQEEKPELQNGLIQPSREETPPRIDKTPPWMGLIRRWMDLIHPRLGFVQPWTD